MVHTLQEFKEQLREDIRDGMKAVVMSNTHANYERVGFLLDIAEEICETKHFLLGEEEKAAARSAVGSSSVLPL